MTESLRSIVYVSAAALPFDDDAIRDLLDQARRNNQRAGITGMLLYHDGNFIQAVEGPPAAIDALLERIRSDARHRSIIVMADELVGERAFADWSMGFMGAEGLAAEGQSNLNDFLSRPSDAPGGGDSHPLALLKSFRRHLR